MRRCESVILRDRGFSRSFEVKVVGDELLAVSDQARVEIALTNTAGTNIGMRLIAAARLARQVKS